MKKRILLIFNPTSGVGRAERGFFKCVNSFCARNWEVLSRVTQCRGDAREQAALYGQQVDAIVCCGGDGTLNEVINGVMTLDKRPPVGYIPTGTTNDFASSLSIPTDLDRAIQNILDGSPQFIDVGRFNERCFSYIASFGAFTESSYSAPQTLKNTVGHLAYLLEGLRDLPRIRPCHVRIESGGCVFEDDYLFGAFSNSTSIAGLVRLSRGIVDFSDGLLEALLIKVPRSANQVVRIINSLTSKKYDDELISFFHLSDATVYTDGRLPWTIDGEFDPGREVCRVSNVHGALGLINCELYGKALNDDKRTS